MTLPVLDWAHAAYEAARRHDHDAEIGALAPLVSNGRKAVDVAMRAWIDRTLIVMHIVMRQSRTTIGFKLEMEDHAGEETDIDQAPAEVAWAGRMFMAYAKHDRGMWEALWSTVPTDPEAITEHVITLLRSMTATAEMYAEQSRPDLSCCPIHAADPMTHAARAAMAHYN